MQLLGVLLYALFATWIVTAQAIYVATFGYGPAAEIPARVYSSSVAKSVD